MTETVPEKCHSDPMQSDSKMFHNTENMAKLTFLSGPPHPPQLQQQNSQSSTSTSRYFM